MKKAVWTAVVVSTLMAGGMGGCQDDMQTKSPEDYVGSAVKDIKAQAARELKKAFSDEVSEFFKSDDLEKSLGIDSKGKKQIESSIKTYIDNYSKDDEKLSAAKESLDKLLENAEGLSVDELQERIAGIFEN